MKANIFVAATSLALFAVDALRIEERAEPSILQFNVQKRTTALSKHYLSKRAGEVSSPDINFQKNLLYIVQLEIGTPPQTIFVQLDTGSSDLFVQTDSSSLCNAASIYNPTPCTKLGAYNANSSSSYNYIDSSFVIAYGGGDGGKGDWVSDNVSISGAVLQGAQFGILYNGNVMEGILGVGYEAIEGRQLFSKKPRYDNFPTLLVKQGYISSRAFSLWTNDDRSASGTILFGAVDTDKFSGELVTIDLVPSGFDGFPGVVDFTVLLDGVTGTDSSGNIVQLLGGSTQMQVLLDSGTTVTILPPDIALSIWLFAGAFPDPDNPNFAIIPCSQGNSNISINLAFNGITVAVPLSQLVIFPDAANKLCMFGIARGNADHNIIGDTVLAALYVVYDLDNNQVSMAPTVFNAATSNILQIVAGRGGVPVSPTSNASSSIPPTTSAQQTTSTSSTQNDLTSTTTITSITPTTLVTKVLTTLKPSATSSAATSGPIPVSPISTFEYLGCYTDNLIMRTLMGIKLAGFGVFNITNTKCIDFCATRGYTLAGTEYGGQCFCGNMFNPFANTQLVADSMCTMPCQGDSTQICGDGLRLSVYKSISQI